MSYVQMDHAGWVETNMAAMRLCGRKPPRGDITRGPFACPEKLSPFQARVMNILGLVGGGIYNAPIPWDAVQWKGWGPDAMAVPWRASADLATFDGHGLTALVFLCHEARIRCSIRNHGVNHLLLCFWQREACGGSMRRHPSLAEAVAAFRAYLPADHSIILPGPAPAVAAE
ncbi:hypothetical protein [Methylobacterium isbiliense]|uniref:Uncharacterized protein n=1 Tax=Methylobacterium isbiliense TaxID=315478 RepID=A0ABQ4SI70_9HYPH|nr:hypothetical protein [Methylobacterium isbiliense]MDN3622552.1 hypothetical protein [Methylobacterium isbiliense]GJE01464.1 hypothetical protein GMJLKIPL_3395 [Methylobacterium isbiliense]